MATPLNIVVVEDNKDLRDAIVEVLCAMDHRVVGLSCAEELGEEGARAVIDLLVVDLNLPGEDGISLSRRLRSIQPGLFILMLTARDKVSDKVSGYDAGADIYLTKPVSIEELSAAVKALERRRSNRLTSSFIEAVLSVHVVQLKAQGPRKSVELNAIEVALLSALARAPGQRLAHWQLLEILTSCREGASLANLAVKMTRLRKKLNETGIDGPTLQATRHEGYQLCLSVQLL